MSKNGQSPKQWDWRRVCGRSIDFTRDKTNNEGRPFTKRVGKNMFADHRQKLQSFGVGRVGRH